MGRLYFDSNNPKACNSFDTPLDLEGDPDFDVSPIILADMGGCSFVSKTRRIQEWRGKLAVVINDKVLDSPERTIMIDDGTGADISIPTILISKEDGDILKAALLSAKGVYIVL